MADKFTWIPIYQELSDELAKWQGRQEELIAFLEGLRTSGHIITPFLDRAETGERFPLKEIDPFTFFGVFNRYIKDENRIALLAEMKNFFELHSSLPDDFDGIPLVNNQSSWFFSYWGKRKIGDIEKLWRVFLLALEENTLDTQEFAQAFDDALTVRRTNVNLTMGLFWIRPYVFLNLDQINRGFLGIKLPPQGLNTKYYLETLKSVQARGKTFPEISLEAWEFANNKFIKKEPGAREDINYWLVGAYWNDRDPSDQTERFLQEGIWENGYQDRFIEEVKSIKVGNKIAIKAATTQKRNLPFDTNNQTISRMTIKAIGTVVANRGDGKTIEVEWEQNFEEKNWYFYTNRRTVWHLRLDEEYKHLDLSEKLRDFIWYGKSQNYDWWLKRWGYFADETGAQDEEIDSLNNPPYGVDDLIASGIFLTENEISQILTSLSSKKALILQGPPGVGKTFLARKLAFALMQEIDNKRLEMVQFHQSYSYDDFVRGYRPVAGKAGSFGLHNGVFYEFCQKALNDPEREYVFT